MAKEADTDTYALNKPAQTDGNFVAPDLPYRPRQPRRFKPVIGLIGCGGITKSHLTAYRKAGYDVVAFADLDRACAEKKRDEYYPGAKVYTDHHELLKRDDVNVVDIATHPPVRVPLIEDALNAGKHVLSQKPFVLDLDAGQRLVDLAERKELRLAVNQNGQWSPHFSYLRQAIGQGLIGDVVGAHLGVHWDHSWTAGTPFEQIPHMILYDFAIHWFDIVTQFMGDKRAKRVFASEAHVPGQKPRPPLLAQVLIEYDGAQSTLAFDAGVPHGSLDHTYIGGTRGSLHSIGPNLGSQTVTITTAAGSASPKLEGSWFPDGFWGTMAELLCAIEEKREPVNSGRRNLESLALCFAAIQSVDTGQPQVPGTVRSLKSWTK